MTTSLEAQALHWFDEALEKPAADRRAWLSSKNLPSPLYEQVLELIDAEGKMGGFLEETNTPADNEHFPRVGERLGSYELIRQLDVGGMGVVFLAKRADDSYEQLVAIKLIRPMHLAAMGDLRDRLVARFETERALLARLNHPNIARILDGGSTRTGVPYLVMEYVDGIRLNLYCERHSLDVEQRLRLFHKVCDGVQEAHRHLIVHRDLKPENILVDTAGEPRLLDFGIARTLDPVGGLERSGATAFTAMTPAYASPEQVRQEPLTTSSDVYSLGVILYQLLSGMPPYVLDGLSPAQAERVISDTEPPTLQHSLEAAELDDTARKSRRVQLDADLNRIVFKAMHKESGRRYSTAQDLANDVQRYINGQPVLAHPDSRTYRFGKFIRRHRIGSAASALAIAAILAAAGVVLWQVRQLARSADDMSHINAFLLDVLKLSDPYQTGGELTMSQALDTAAESIDQRFSDRPDLSASLRFGIGYSMLSHHRLEEASQQLNKARAESEAQFGLNDIRSIATLKGIAELRKSQGRMEEAIALYNEAIERMEASRLQTDPLYFQMLGNIGNIEIARENFAVADTFIRRSLVGAAKPPSFEHATAVSNLASAAHGLHDIPRADRLYREAQAELEELFPQGSPDLATVLNNRAVLADDSGKQRESLVLYEQSLAMRRQVFGREHPMIVVALATLTRKAVELGEQALALDSAKQATAMAEHVYSEPNGHHAYAYLGLADAYILSDDMTSAAVALRRAQDILATLPENPPSIVRIFNSLRTKMCRDSKYPGFAIDLCDSLEP